MHLFHINIHIHIYIHANAHILKVSVYRDSPSSLIDTLIGTVKIPVKDIWRESRLDGGKDGVWKDGVWVFRGDGVSNDEDSSSSRSPPPNSSKNELWKWFDVPNPRSSIGGGVEDLIDGIFHTASSAASTGLSSTSTPHQSIDIHNESNRMTMSSYHKDAGSTESLHKRKKGYYVNNGDANAVKSTHPHMQESTQPSSSSSTKNIQVLIRLQLDDGASCAGGGGKERESVEEMEKSMALEHILSDGTFKKKHVTLTFTHTHTHIFHIIQWKK